MKKSGVFVIVVLTLLMFLMTACAPSETITGRAVGVPNEEALACCDTTDSNQRYKIATLENCQTAGFPVVDSNYCELSFFEKIKRYFTAQPTPVEEESEEITDKERRKRSSTGTSSRISTPECCTTDGYLPLTEGECAVRGYPVVEMSYCAELSAPLPATECCDTSSTSNYVATEENGCQAYGLEEVDASYCSDSSAGSDTSTGEGAVPMPPTSPSPDTGCCQELRLVCEHTNFMGNNNLGPEEPVSEEELPRLRNGNEACSDDWSDSSCVLTYGIDPVTNTMMVRPCGYSYRDLEIISLDFPTAVCCRLND